MEVGLPDKYPSLATNGVRGSWPDWYWEVGLWEAIIAPVASSRGSRVDYFRVCAYWTTGFHAIEFDVA